MTAFGEELADLRDSADRGLQRYESAAAAAIPVSATDTSGDLTVHLAADGQLVRVTLVSTWRTSIGPARLASATLEAYTAGAAERVRAWAQHIADDDSSGATRPAPPASDSVASELADIVRANSNRLDSEGALRSLAEMLREVNVSLDSAMEQVRERARREYLGRSAAGHATAWSDGSGALIRLEVDKTWASRAHGTNIGREITEAVRASTSTAISQAPASVFDGTALASVAADAADARGLAARLGLL